MRENTKGFLMVNTVNSLSTIVKSTALLPKAQKNPVKQIANEQQSDVCSSQSSNAARAMALGGINFAKTSEKVPEVNYTEGIKATVLDETTGDEVNKWWRDEMNYPNPPYLPKSKVQHIKLDEDTKFVRVYDGENSGMYGGWIMKESDVAGLTPEQIKDKYALPQKPIKVCDVTLPKGTELRTGITNPLKGWGKGGGVQFDLMGQRIGVFDNERLIENNNKAENTDTTQ